MIQGKTIQKVEVTEASKDIRGEFVLSFTDGTKMTVLADGQMDFYRSDKDSGRMDWVHPANLN